MKRKLRLGLFAIICACVTCGCSLTLTSFSTSSITSHTINTTNTQSSNNDNNANSSSTVKSISLNYSTRTLSIGESVKLIADVNPANQSSNIDFTSIDSSVASVSEEGLVTALKEGKTTITASSKDGLKSTSCLITVSNESVDDWTIMIYMCGSSLESGYENGRYEYDDYLASSDIDEIVEGNKPESVNIILETGGSKRWRSNNGYGISSSKLERWEVSGKTLTKVDSLTNASMGKSATFQNFLEWGLKNYPAERTGVILWNHGGAMFGVCNDENYNDDDLTSNEVKTALTNAFNTTGRDEKLEWIGYDACLMQLQDVADFNSGFFNYMVASQESEEGNGWDYDVWLNTLYNNPKNVTTKTLLKSVADSFISDNGGVNKSGGDQTLSCLDLSKMNDYHSSWETLASDLTTVLKNSTSNVKTFNNLVNSTKYFGGTDYDYFCTFDAMDFLKNLQTSSTFKSINSISSAISSLEDVIVYNTVQTSKAKDAYGLSFYYVIDNSYRQSSYCTSTYSNFTCWNALSKTYGTQTSSWGGYR